MLSYVIFLVFFFFFSISFSLYLSSYKVVTMVYYYALYNKTLILFIK